MSTPIQSTTVVHLAPGEVELASAFFGPLLYGDTITSVADIVQKSGTTTLTYGTPAINTGGAVTVDGNSRAVRTVVQFTITVPSNATPGDYVATCTITTASWRVKNMDCLIVIS
jgi:hypothetical protein